MPEDTWTVIQFIDDKSVAAVPSSWIQGDDCYWPNYPQEKLNTAIRKCEPFNTCWPTHRVRLFRNATYDNYMKARNKTKLAEITSDLNTETEDRDGYSKRRRIQKFLSSSSDDEESDQDSAIPLAIPAPPKLGKNRNDSSSMGEKSLPNTNDAIITGEMEDVCVDSKTSLPKASMPKLDTSTTREMPSALKRDTDFKTILQQIHIVRGMTMDILTEVKEIGKEVRRSKEVHTTDSFLTNGELNIPISTEADFLKLEDALTSKEEMNKAAAEISKLGGGSIYDFIKRGLQVLISNNFALEYSWLGRKNKKPFKGTNTASLLIKAAEYTNLCTSQKEVEVSIQTWLRRASDRRNAERLKKKF